MRRRLWKEVKWEGCHRSLGWEAVLLPGSPLPILSGFVTDMLDPKRNKRYIDSFKGCHAGSLGC
jgi:hypothetical protein